MRLPLSPNLTGALFMAISMAGFTINDTFVKVASSEMNMGQVMAVRGLFATILICLLAWHQGALRMPRLAFHPMVVARTVGELGGTVFFLVALAHLPLANVSAILQALPLGVTMGAALFFAEPVGWRRWTSIACGFLGVLIVVRPGFDGFSVYALSALLSVAFCTVRDLATRRIPQHVPTLLVSVTAALSVTICGAILVQPLGGWTPMTVEMTGTLLAAACLLLVGYQFIILSMRIGDISAIAPFRYTALLWSILLGYLVFGDVPDGPMIVGATVIVLSGLYMLYRERKVSQQMPAARSTSPAMAPDGL